MLAALLGLTLTTPEAAAGCTGGQCSRVEGVESTAAAEPTGSSLALRPGAHLRTATFALG